MPSLDASLAPAEPHPDLVVIQRPTPREVAEVASVLGMLSDPDARWFRPAVSAERGV